MEIGFGADGYVVSLAAAIYVRQELSRTVVPGHAISVSPSAAALLVRRVVSAEGLR